MRQFKRPHLANTLAVSSSRERPQFDVSRPVALDVVDDVGHLTGPNGLYRFIRNGAWEVVWGSLYGTDVSPYPILMISEIDGSHCDDLSHVPLLASSRPEFLGTPHAYLKRFEPVSAAFGEHIPSSFGFLPTARAIEAYIHGIHPPADFDDVVAILSAWAICDYFRRVANAEAAMRSKL